MKTKSPSCKPAKVNLPWAASMLRAKAGLNTKMAIGKKVAQKARARLKKAHGGVLPSPSEDLHDRLRTMAEQRAARQRHHLIKQLQQAAKRARTFLVRRLLRKRAQASGGNAQSQPEGEEDEQLRALKAVAPAAVARRALQQLGFADDVLMPLAAAEEATPV